MDRRLNSHLEARDRHADPEWMPGEMLEASVTQPEVEAVDSRCHRDSVRLRMETLLFDAAAIVEVEFLEIRVPRLH